MSEKTKVVFSPTPKQKEAIKQLNANVQAAEHQRQIYLQGIVDGLVEPPADGTVLVLNEDLDFIIKTR